MIDPGVQSALIGVFGVAIAYAGKIGICYASAKLRKVEKCKIHPVCGQHAQLVNLVNKISEHYADEKQVELYSRAIERVNSKK